MRTAKEKLKEAIRLIDRYEDKPLYYDSMIVVVDVLCSEAVTILTERSLGATTANTSSPYK